jgi:hypothetical protein
VKDNGVAWFLLRCCGDVCGEIWFETPKYEGKKVAARSGRVRDAETEGYFGDGSVALAGVIIILALRNLQNLFTSY